MTGYTNQYLANQVNTASPEQLLLMFYDGAIRFSALAVLAIEKQNIEKRNYYINKASAILSELSATLNHDINSIIAEDLDALYSYMLSELTNANMHNDPQPIVEVKKMLDELRKTWKQAIEMNNQEKNKNIPHSNQAPVFQHA